MKDCNIRMLITTANTLTLYIFWFGKSRKGYVQQYGFTTYDLKDLHS